MKTMWITATWETSHEIEVPDDYEWDGRSIDAEWADQVDATCASLVDWTVTDV